ncbi:MAG: cyclic dehypoxanthinyl futalosine synthase [Candidatus Nitrosocaldaceae archaeon]
MLLRLDIDDIFEKIKKKERLGYDDCLRLMNIDIHTLGYIANMLNRDINGNTVTFINNLILNYTNVCVTYCKFCAFYRPPNHEEGYTLSIDECLKRIKMAEENYRIKQVLLQGGHNPSLKLEFYEELFKAIKKNSKVAIHGLSPSEVDMISKVEKTSVREVLARLRSAGLDSLAGAGAEILVDEVREKISPLKIKSDEWIRIMEEAHKLGIPSSATMMYGHVESLNDRVTSLMKIIELQEKTGGFIAFIPWSFEPNNTLLKDEVKYSSGGLDLLRMVSVSRIMLYGLINHIQSSWLTNGIRMAQLALLYGADDFGGTLYGEEVVSATGARSTTLNASNIIDAIKALNLRAAERDNMYNIITIL